MKRILAILCVFTLLTTGCASASASTQGSGTGTELYGKVTSISGNQVTLALGTLNEAHGDRSASRPEGKARNGSAPAKHDGSTSSGSVSPDKPSGKTSNGTTPRGNGAFQMLTLTGEQKVITVSNEKIISARSTESTSSAALSDIKVNSILKLTMNGDTVTAIEIVQSGRNGKKAPPSSSSK
jgi:hypothetical protein